MRTINDYKQECERVQERIATTTNVKVKGQLTTYLHRLWKEMQDYEYYKNGKKARWQK